MGARRTRNRGARMGPRRPRSGRASEVQSCGWEQTIVLWGGAPSAVGKAQLSVWKAKASPGSLQCGSGAWGGRSRKWVGGAGSRGLLSPTLCLSPPAASSPRPGIDKPPHACCMAVGVAGARFLQMFPTFRSVPSGQQWCRAKTHTDTAGGH